jgi:flagellar biosynthetic protein FlhB
MAETAQDRTLPATPRKIEKAREEGQVARSRDLSHLAALGVGGALLALLAPSVVGWMGERLAAALRFDAGDLAHPRAMVERLAAGGGELLLAVVPLGALLAAVGVLAGLLAGGWNFTWKALAPTWEKVDPLAGLKRMVSAQQLAVMGKASLLAVVLGIVGGVYLWWKGPEFLHLAGVPLPRALGDAGALLWGGIAPMLLALAAFAVVDVPLQRLLLLRRLRMSHEELKKEMKEVEGNTEVKARMRLRMRELAHRRMLAAVPLADLVVMNPTHFAVALKYDESRMAAPRVVAKGADLMAFRIRDAAQGARVPVLQAPPLARALYAHCEVDQEIPARLFTAVAQVLAWVYQLRGAGRDLPPPEVEVPPDLDPARSGGGGAA